jgi:YggT family protein
VRRFPREGENMFVLGNFIVAVAKIIDLALSIYMWIIIARAIISWVNPDPYNQIVQFLYRVTEPVMAPVRRWLPMRGMGIDLSPLVILLIIFFLQSFLVKSMIELAAYLR